MDAQDSSGRQECKQRRIFYWGGDESSLPVSHQASGSWQLLPLTASGLLVAASFACWAEAPAPSRAGQRDRFTSPEQHGSSSLDAHGECRFDITLQGTLQSTILAVHLHPFSRNKKPWLPIVCSMKGHKEPVPETSCVELFKT